MAIAYEGTAKNRVDAVQCIANPQIVDADQGPTSYSSADTIPTGIQFRSPSAFFRILFILIWLRTVAAVLLIRDADPGCLSRIQDPHQRI
jgi:hypothetical protein